MDFQYKARNIRGGVQVGIVKAADRTAAIDVLKKNNLDVFYLEAAAAKSLGSYLSMLGSMVSEKDLVIFSRQLAVLIESNLPIIRALRTIGEQTSSPGMANICRSMATSVEEGNSFSYALERFPKQFDKFYSSVVKSGETSGSLQNSLQYLADHLEKSYELKRKIKGALMYPASILLAFVAIFFFLMVKVLPQLTDVLKESGVPLPWTTQIVIATSDFMEDRWWVVLLVMIGIGGGLFAYMRTGEGKKSLDAIVLGFPVIGVLVQYAYITRFAENLRVLLHQGVSIVESFRIMSEVMDNDIYRRVMISMLKSVEKGKSMTEGMMEDERAFPKMIPQMIRVGEEAGRTEDILKTIENFYSKEVDNMTNNMTTLIEPLLIMVLGVGAGVLVAAIIMPIYDMAGSM